MNQHSGSRRWLLTAAALAAAVSFLAARSVDRFAITSCSLGCAAGGASVTCGVTSVFVNEELRIGFSDEVAPGSVSPFTFKVIELATGQFPAGSYSIDPADPRVVVFRPQLSFGPTGVPSFGFQAGASYRLEIPGLKLDPGSPHVLSVNGLPVWNRLLCTVSANQGVMDPVPGPPTVCTEVRVVVEHDGTQTITAPAPARGATRVALDTDITFAFDDVMNLGTLLNPSTGQSTSILIGRSSTPGADPVAGSFSFNVDPGGKTTAVVFDPDPDLLPAETVFVTLQPTIQDLVGNPLVGPGTFSFATEG